MLRRGYAHISAVVWGTFTKLLEERGDAPLTCVFCMFSLLFFQSLSPHGICGLWKAESGIWNLT